MSFICLESYINFTDGPYVTPRLWQQLFATTHSKNF